MNEKFAENVSKSPESIEKAKHTIAAGAMNDHALEAAANAEEIIGYLGELWGDRAFTPEQCVFALALVTINYREGVPAQFGGKEMFDRIAVEARKYFDANR
jgi:hypothetical protein